MILVQDADDLGDGLGVGDDVMSAADDEFGIRSVEMAAPIGHDPVGPVFFGTRALLPDNAVKGDRDGKIGKGNERGAFGRERSHG